MDRENGSNTVANAGSTIGEAIGILIEREVNRILRPIAEDNGCLYVSLGKTNLKTGKPTKLILKDISGNEYNIDAVIANAKMQPLVLIESKYIRYKKHNRDKGSWICTAHYSLRHTYPTVRKSIAVLAGSWSQPSKALLESFDVSLFEVSFSKIAKTLETYGVDINWEEKEKERAMVALQNWASLAPPQLEEIAHKLLSEVEPALRSSLVATLDNTIARLVNEVEVIIETNLGESRRYTFTSVAAAIEFLEAFDEETVLNDETGPSLWEISN